ncbi:MAG: para-aminobenzoate synthetase component 2 [Candidatus Omnitrophota bacterium]|jgi:para-aminobenzoate synthetase component 2
MILMIDNYDSFTYNLVQYLGELGEDLVVKRNDEITIDQIKKMRPDRMVVSPGPGKPINAGVSKQAIKTFEGQIPILGVCLGHQCISEVYGGKIVIAKRIMHGKTSEIIHQEHALFKGLDNPFIATRYHSLILDNKTVPNCLEVIAQTKEAEIMAVAHKIYPTWGMQFHPESILTECGKAMLKNFLEYKVK